MSRFFENQLLILRDINGDEQPSEVSFIHSQFWIRVYDVSFGKGNASFATDVEEILGGVEYDDSDPLGWEGFMCIKVLLDIDKPLRRRFKLGACANGSKWVSIQY